MIWHMVIWIFNWIKMHIFGFEIIEVLLYAMRLKAVGIEDRKIQEGIIKIMGFNFALD